MVMNIVEATDLLDNDLKDDEIDYLVAARQGFALDDVPDAILKTLIDHGLVDIVPFDHPRAVNAIKGVVVSEAGVKILNVIDNRRWNEELETLASPPVISENNEAIAKAQSTTKDKADNKSGAIKKDSPLNKDYDNRK